MTAAFVFGQLGVTGGWTDARALHDAMHAVDGVKTIHFVAGLTDNIAFVESVDTSGLTVAIGKIRGLNGVSKTDTRIVLPM